jgi:DNA-binding transcriptional ArsR family regulator
MIGAKVASPEVIQQVAEYFGILSLLVDGDKRVQDIVDATQTSQANVSKHLKVMLQANIPSCRSEGTSAYYCVEDRLIFELCDLVCNQLAERMEQRASEFRQFRNDKK